MHYCSILQRGEFEAIYYAENDDDSESLRTHENALLFSIMKEFVLCSLQEIESVVYEVNQRNQDFFSCCSHFSTLFDVQCERIINTLFFHAWTSSSVRMASSVPPGALYDCCFN